MTLSSSPIAGRLEENWIDLRHLVMDVMSIDEAPRYTGLLNKLRDDTQTPEGLLLGFKRAPAAQGNHHAFEGGLVYHYLEMWDLWLTIRNAQHFVQDTQYINDARVLKGIINHDLHKAWRTYRLDSEAPWQTQYCEDESDKLLGSDARRPRGCIKNLWILQNAGIFLDMIDYNVILNAEGGWSETPTYWTTITAKLCYLLDEMSGNVVGRVHSSRYLGHNQKVVLGGGSGA